MQLTSTPDLSIIVNMYNMPREGPRTLLSLTANYQQDVTACEYEVLVVENGSSEPLSHEQVNSYGENFHYLPMDYSSPSPVKAINEAVKHARGKAIGIIVDGARIITPGMVRYALKGLQNYNNPFVYTLGWHLGPDIQQQSILNGYNQAREDELLTSIEWEHNGYRMFTIGTLAGSSRFGWFLPISESNCFFMKQEMWLEFGGFDERFDLPGGGLANLDIFRRACELPDSELVMLLGEGSFHQLHGGVTTGVSGDARKKLWNEFAAQYQAIRGREYEMPDRRPEMIGHLPVEALDTIAVAAEAIRNERA